MIEIRKRKMLDSESAVSEVIGFLSIFALSISAVTIIVAMGLPGVMDSQSLAKLQNVEQAFTVLDSKTSLSALGESPSQVIELDTAGGTISVLNDSTIGSLTIVMSQEGVNYIIYSSTIGTLQYELNGEKVAYEGGGVWRKYAAGGAIMISPPEFHFNGETLTLPIVRLTGNSSTANGIATVHTSSENSPTVIFQNTTANPLFKNPLYGSTTIITVKSEYYKAWASYMQERTEFHGVVTHDNQSEAVAYLNSRPLPVVNFTIPLDIVGLNTSNPAPVSIFSFELYNVTSDFHLDLAGSNSEGRNLTISMQKKTGGGDSGIAVTISYQELTDEVETWEATKWTAIEANETASVNLLNASISMTYESNDDSWTWLGEASPYDKTYTKTGSDEVPLPIAIQHYFRLMGPTFTFDYGQKHEGFNETASKIHQEYECMPPIITFLHIVEHRVDVNIM